jgi:transposase
MAAQAQYIERIKSLEQDNQALLESNDYYKNHIDQLNQMIHDLKRHRFGKRSEAYHHPDQKQFDFLQDAEPAKVIDTASVTIEKHTRKKNKKKKPQLPTKVVIIEADKQCTCGHDKEVIRYDVSQRINFQPEVYEIIEERREVVTCKQHCEGSTHTAKAPKRFLPKTGVTESFIANIIVSKFDDRQPLYHQERRLKSRFGIQLSRQNMARWIISSAAQIMPLYNLMIDSLINYDIASMDATTIQVLDEPGRAASTKSYMYCFRGGGEEDQVILYDYNHTDHQAFVANWFEGFSGYIHSDADAFFHKLYQQDNVHSALCHAHARRKFEAIAKTSKKAVLAHHAMQVYRKLYAVEKKAKHEKLNPDETKQLRQKHAKPLLITFKTWLENKIGLVPQQSPIFKAMRYTLKNWEGFIRYLDDGRLSIDNNHTEREIKPFVIARKNFMFAKSQAGARAMALHFSLIRTAKLHGLDPYRYYVQIMEQIPYCETVEDYEKLLPWHIDMSKVITES